MSLLQRARWQLFFPEPMDALDRGNLEACGIRRVQMFLDVAANMASGAGGQSPDQLDWLASRGVRVTLRIEEPARGREAQSYYNPGTHGAILSKIDQVRQHVGVEAAIMGNESEHDYDLTWASTNWGNNPDQWFPRPGGKAQAHREAVLALGQAIHQRWAGAVKPVSPGWSHKRLRPKDPPQPGRQSWREIVLPAYNGMVDGRQVYDPANGAHLYADNWISEEDRNRYLWSAGIEAERCHREIWLNETNVNNVAGGTALEHMSVIVEMARLLSEQEWGRRFVSVCPFVSNGLANAYRPGYIMRERSCYELLAARLQ